ncbi:MAG: serpin family protein [Deltaproteobacteria bacterium]|jgi:serpin B|nr:serpin family protein [Deltaproteobacteria bacterium]
MRIALFVLSALLPVLCISVPSQARTGGADSLQSPAAPAESDPSAGAAAPPAAAQVQEKPAGPASAPASDESARALARGLNGFGWNLYRALAAEDGNVFVSPLSAAEALAMTHAGSGGGTRDELAAALGFPYSGDELARSWKSLREELVSAGGAGGGEAVFALADSLWPDSAVALRSEYLDALTRAFGPSVFPVDYSSDAEGARVAINDWTLDVTNGRIGDLVASPLPEETVLVLVNAVYFKGKWQDAFPGGGTEEGDFREYGGKAAKVMFMNRTASFPYLEDDLGQALELPYLGGRLSMVVLLPADGEGGLARLEAAATGESLDARLRALAARRAAVKLPRFAFSWGTKSLRDALEALGVKEAFTDAADFSAMSGTRGFRISDVFHKAFVEVNEEGTEAAAATGAGMVPTSMPLPPLEFTADRPFLFLIRDRATGAVIFLGRFSGPPA